MFISRTSVTGISPPLRREPPSPGSWRSGGLARVRQNRRPEAGELGEVRGDLSGGDSARVVAHDAEAVVQRDRGCVDPWEPLQGEARRRGAAPAGHPRDVEPRGGVVGMLGCWEWGLPPTPLDPPAAKRAEERGTAESSGEKHPSLH